MSLSAIILSVYLVVGLILLVVYVAAPGKERRTRPFAPGDGMDMVLLSLLWPIWLIGWMLRKHDRSE